MQQYCLYLLDLVHIRILKTLEWIFILIFDFLFGLRILSLSLILVIKIQINKLINFNL